MNQIQSSAHSAEKATTDEPSSERAKAAVLTWFVAISGFTATWFVLGFVSDGYTIFDVVIDGYSPIAQPISGLGLGRTATAMNAAFVVYGLASLLGALGIGRLFAADDPRSERIARLTFGLHGHAPWYESLGVVGFGSTTG